MMYQHERKERTERYHGPRPGFPAKKGFYAEMMHEYLAARQLNAALAMKNGWYPTHWQHAPRIVIPCTNSAGVPYFQARDMTGRAFVRYASPAATREDSIVLVWPADTAKATVIVEGPMDALAAAGCGFLGIAVMGNEPNDRVLDLIAHYARVFQPVYIVPDIDLVLGPHVLCALAQRGLVGMILAPPAKDLAEMPPQARRSFLCH